MPNYSYYVELLRRLPYGLARRLTSKRCYGYAAMAPHFAGRHGLEIGGPSRIFARGHLIPVYDTCARIDNCNFSNETIWSTRHETRSFGPHFGEQFVAEACDLLAIADGTFDFLIASHVLEHVANPLRAIQEWKRVVKSEGSMIIVVPDKHTTFDRRRPFTQFSHLEADFRRAVTEDDVTYLDEILELHDLTLDPGAGSKHEFKERCLINRTVRAMHHHVFSPEVLVSMFDRFQMRVLNVAIERPFHIIGFAQKAERASYEQVRKKNLPFLDKSATWRRHDPFRHSRETELLV